MRLWLEWKPGAAVAATAAILRRLILILLKPNVTQPQSPRLRQS